jgi:plasmid maintenance system antidote protein VapI
MGQQNGLPNHFGGYLADLLEERDLGTDDLVRATNLSHEHVGQFLTGQGILTADVALLLGDFFEVSPLYLLDLQIRCCIGVRDENAVRAEPVGKA